MTQQTQIMQEMGLNVILALPQATLQQIAHLIILPDSMPNNAERDKQILTLINKIFIVLDLVLTATCLTSCFAFISHPCVAFMFLYYSGFYCMQAGQHILMSKFPSIDINKHFVLYRRLIIAICLYDASYLFGAIMFWQMTNTHPMYCALCTYFGFGAWVGLLLIFHFIFALAWAVSLIQSYISRRYYLLALGGFEVEQQIVQQRQRQLHQMMIRQPNYNQFPLADRNSDKYFKFEDAADAKIEDECSICLSQDDKESFVNAGCGHFYHEACLANWAKLNSTCPQCRHRFEEEPNPPVVAQQQI